MVNQLHGRRPIPRERSPLPARTTMAQSLRGKSQEAPHCARVFLQHWVCVILTKL
jgi:hypothetical protein